MRIMIFVCSAGQESPWGARLLLEAEIDLEFICANLYAGMNNY